MMEIPAKKFCGDCGTALDSRCPQCGTDNRAGQKHGHSRAEGQAAAREALRESLAIARDI